jgi:hypothetical protein
MVKISNESRKGMNGANASEIKPMEAIYSPKRMHKRRRKQSSVKIAQNGERDTAVKTQVAKRH